MAKPPMADERIVPIPLRQDVSVQIAFLPRDLTRAEAEKICRVVKSFVQEQSHGR